MLACLMHETWHVHAILACTGEPLNTHDTQEMSQAYTWFTTVHALLESPIEEEWSYQIC